MKLAYNVLLTSFVFAKTLKCGNKFSVARTKPAWAKKYKELDFLAPIDKNGKAIRLSNYPHNPTGGYAMVLKETYISRWTEISEWLESLKVDEQYVLCCWCPHSKSTKEQIKEFGSFACHTLLIAKLIRKNRPDLIVKLDDEREEKGFPEWKDYRFVQQAFSLDGANPIAAYNKELVHDLYNRGVLISSGDLNKKKCNCISCKKVIDKLYEAIGFYDYRIKLITHRKKFICRECFEELTGRAFPGN